MITGGWSFVYAAYALTGGGLIVLAGIVLLRLRHWAKQAKSLDRE